MRRDPLESTLLSSLFFGGVFIIVAAIKLVIRILVATGNAAGAKPEQGFQGVLVFLVGFAVVVGPVVALARTRMARNPSYRAKNFVTGGLVAACYSLGCLAVFSAGMDATGKIFVGTLTLAGVWWAITSALNEIFRESPLGNKGS